MRKFNDFEKEIIKKIGKEYNHIANFLDEYLKLSRIRVYRIEDKAELLFEVENKLNLTEEESVRLIDQLHDLTYIIVSTVNLLKYLEQQDLITLYRSASVIDEIFTFGQGATNKDIVSYEIPDKTIVDYLIRYVEYTIIPTNDLVAFVEAGFKTLQDIQKEEEIEQNNKNFEINLVNAKATEANVDLAKENLKVSRSNSYAAWTAAIISLIALSITIYFGLTGTFKFENSQFKKLLDGSEKINFSIDSLNNTLQNDTINNHVFSISDSIIIAPNNDSL
jgi:hypothetical protein